MPSKGFFKRTQIEEEVNPVEPVRYGSRKVFKQSTYEQNRTQTNLRETDLYLYTKYVDERTNLLNMLAKVDNKTEVVKI